MSIRWLGLFALVLWNPAPLQAKTSPSIVVQTYRPKHPEYRWLKRFLQLRGYQLAAHTNASSTTLKLQLTAGSKVIIAKGQHTKRYSIPQRLSSPQTRARVCALYLDMFLETLQHTPPSPSSSAATQAGSSPSRQKPEQRPTSKRKRSKPKKRAKRRLQRRVRRRVALTPRAAARAVSPQRTARPLRQRAEPPSKRATRTTQPAEYAVTSAKNGSLRSRPPQQRKTPKAPARLRPPSPTKDSRMARIPTSRRPQPPEQKRQTSSQVRRLSVTPKPKVRANKAKKLIKFQTSPGKNVAMVEVQRPQPIRPKRRVWGDILSLDIGLSGGLRYASDVLLQGGGSVLLGLNAWRWTVRFDLHLHSYHLTKQTREILFLRPSIWLGYRIPLGRAERWVEFMTLLGVVSEFAVKHDETAYTTEMIWGTALGLHLGFKLSRRWSLFVRPSLHVYPQGVRGLYQNTVDLDPAGNASLDVVVPAFQFSALLGVQVRL